MKAERQEAGGAADDRRSRERKPEGVMHGLALFTQLGLSMCVCVLIGVLAGGWLDRVLGTRPWLLLFCSFLGGGGAFKVMYDLTVKGAGLPSPRRMIANRLGGKRKAAGRAGDEPAEARGGGEGAGWRAEGHDCDSPAEGRNSDSPAERHDGDSPAERHDGDSPAERRRDG